MTFSARHKKIQDFSEIAAFHHRARQDVLRKIHRVYHLSDEDTQLQDTFAAALEKHIAQDMAQPKWQDRLKSALGPDAKEEDKRAAESVMIQIMLDYAHAFQLRSTLSDMSETIVMNGPNPTILDEYQKFYRSSFTKENMMELYINHITNEAQSRLTLLTHGDEKAAFSLHTLLIGTLLWGCVKYDYPSKMIQIRPRADRDLSAEDNIKNMADFWREVAGNLHKSYRKNGSPYPSHVEKLRAPDYVDTPLTFMASR